MAIGPIGNAIYVNQQTASVASVQNSHNNRVDMQNMFAQAAANEKEKTILEVRPTEETHEVDPDREHTKNEADQESKRNKKKDEDTQSSEETTSTFLHKLDIKV